MNACLGAFSPKLSKRQDASFSQCHAIDTIEINFIYILGLYLISVVGRFIFVNSFDNLMLS